MFLLLSALCLALAVLWPGRAGTEEYAVALDGDGVSGLLIQGREDPCGMNAVFHWDGGKIVCWRLGAIVL